MAGGRLQIKIVVSSRFSEVSEEDLKFLLDNFYDFY